MPYSGDPSSSVLDAVRFWLQDTSSSPLFSDNELRYMIATVSGYSSDAILIAAELCGVIVAKFAGEVRVSGDGIEYDPSEVGAKYQALAPVLRDTYALLNGNKGIPTAGSTGCGPLFRLGQNDMPENPQLGQPWYVQDPADYQTNL